MRVFFLICSFFDNALFTRIFRVLSFIWVSILRGLVAVLVFIVAVFITVAVI